MSCGPEPVIFRLLDEHAVLVQHATVSLPSLDVDLYDALRSV